MKIDLRGYVAAVIGDEVVVRDAVRELAPELHALGFRRGLIDRSEFRASLASEADLPRLFSQLRDLSVAFAGASGGWPPAAVFEDLRTRGLVTGEFREVFWTGSEVPQVIMR